MNIISRFFQKRIKISLFFLFFLTVPSAFAQTDFFKIPSITLDNQTYDLKWSADMRRTKVIQEYVLPGESVTQYNTKLILEYIKDGQTVEQLSSAKLLNLADEKAEERVLSFQQIEIENPEEAVIEFMTAKKQDGAIVNIEWNVYRYQPVPGGVVLFIMSKRAYEEKNVPAFFSTVSQNRVDWIKSVLAYQLPR